MIDKTDNDDGPEDNDAVEDTAHIVLNDSTSASRGSIPGNARNGGHGDVIGAGWWAALDKKREDARTAMLAASAVEDSNEDSIEHNNEYDDDGIVPSGPNGTSAPIVPNTPPVPVIQDGHSDGFSHRAADYANDHRDKTKPVDVGENDGRRHLIYRPETLDDIITVLSSLKSGWFRGDGNVPVRGLIRTSGVSSSVTGLAVDYGSDPVTGRRMIILGSESWLPYEAPVTVDNDDSVDDDDTEHMAALSVLSQEREATGPDDLALDSIPDDANTVEHVGYNDSIDTDVDEPDERVIARVMAAVKSIHDDDIREINRLRVLDEDLYRVAKIADGIVTAGSDEHGRDDDTIREAVLDAIRLTEERGV